MKYYKRGWVRIPKEWKTELKEMNIYKDKDNERFVKIDGEWYRAHYRQEYGEWEVHKRG